MNEEKNNSDNDSFSLTELDSTDDPNPTLYR